MSSTLKHEIETTHPDYERMDDSWKTCRDLFDGAKAMRAAGTRYVPRLTGQTDEEYRAYLIRGRFFNGFARTVGALTGVAFAKDPTLTLPDQVKVEYFKDVTLSGEPFASFVPNLVADVLTVGRAGCLVDFSDAQKRPYWVSYRAEDILMWDTQTQGGDTHLTYLVLREQEWVREGFKVVHRPRIRVCELLPGQTPRYQVTVYRRVEKEGKAEWVSDAPVFPTRRAAELPFIPFVFFGPLGITSEVVKPPMMDLAEVNLSHWRSSVDLKHGEHFTALPTPVITGQRIDTELRIGSTKAWVLPEPGADAKYLEFEGNGLGAIRSSLQDDERLMAVLGTRMLEQQKAGQEAAATVRMRHSGDDATLHAIVGSVSTGLTVLSRWTAWWGGFLQDPKASDVSVALNTEFGALDIPVDTLALLSQAGKISFETFYFNLQRAGLARPGINAQQEREQIIADGGDDPAAAPKPQEPENPDDDDDDDQNANDGGRR